MQRVRMYIDGFNFYHKETPPILGGRRASKTNHWRGNRIMHTAQAFVNPLLMDIPKTQPHPSFPLRGNRARRRDPGAVRYAARGWEI